MEKNFIKSLKMRDSHQQRTPAKMPLVFVIISGIKLIIWISKDGEAKYQVS